MKILKKYDYIYKYILFILILSLIITIISLIFNPSPSITKIIILISMIVYSFIIGVKKGLRATNKAYKDGLKTGLINILILYLLGCITFNFSLPLRKILYFIIIVISTIFGSIIGINKKNSN